MSGDRVGLQHFKPTSYCNNLVTATASLLSCYTLQSSMFNSPQIECLNKPTSMQWKNIEEAASDVKDARSLLLYASKSLITMLQVPCSMLRKAMIQVRGNTALARKNGPLPFGSLKKLFENGNERKFVFAGRQHTGYNAPGDFLALLTVLCTDYCMTVMLA